MQCKKENWHTSPLLTINPTRARGNEPIPLHEGFVKLNFVIHGWFVILFSERDAFVCSRTRAVLHRLRI
jgi:hypothetical protein